MASLLNQNTLFMLNELFFPKMAVPYMLKNLVPTDRPQTPTEHGAEKMRFARRKTPRQQWLRERA